MSDNLAIHFNKKSATEGSDKEVEDEEERLTELTFVTKKLSPKHEPPVPTAFKKSADIANARSVSFDSAIPEHGSAGLGTNIDFRQPPASEPRKWLTDKMEKISKNFEDRGSIKERITATIKRHRENAPTADILLTPDHQNSADRTIPAPVSPRFWQKKQPATTLTVSDSSPSPPISPISKTFPANLYQPDKKYNPLSTSPTLKSFPETFLNSHAEEEIAEDVLSPSEKFHFDAFEDALEESTDSVNTDDQLVPMSHDNGGTNRKIISSHEEAEKETLARHSLCCDIGAEGDSSNNTQSDSNPNNQELSDADSNADKIQSGEKITDERSWLVDFVWRFLKYGIIAILALTYNYLPVSPFISGLIAGVVIATAVLGALCWMCWPTHHLSAISTPEFEYKKYPCLHEDTGNIYKGWMNELLTDYYADDYHINQTYSVYIRLEGILLRLSRPKQNIPRRAMFNEPTYEPTFIHQRHFEMTDAKVYLAPAGLAKKRIWSKKYPICIELARGGKKISRRMTSSAIPESSSPSEGLFQQQGLAGVPHSASMEILSKEDCSDSLVRLFARTNREKEMWFRRLQAAVNLSKRDTFSKPEHRKSGFTAESAGFSTIGTSLVLPLESHSSNELDFDRYMARFLVHAGKLTPKQRQQSFGSVHKIKRRKSRRQSSLSSAQAAANASTDEEESMDKENIGAQFSCGWLNALLGRTFYDFLREEKWRILVQTKIQRKLEKIKVPMFMDVLTVRDLDLGVSIPHVRNVKEVRVDEQGLWLDVSVAYDGSFYMTIETKLNLMKLKAPPSAAEERDQFGVTFSADDSAISAMNFPVQKQRRPKSELLEKKSRRMALSDSEAEDSAESSSDEEEQQQALSIAEATIAAPENADSDRAGNATASTGRKLLRMVDKVAASKYFQQATEYKVIKRAMEGISNTPLILTVEVKSLIGILAINIPPPPTDRIWYGFRGNPYLNISAKPKVGMRQVSIGYVTDWIEKRLTLEFQRMLVMPNMDDFYIPVMYSDVKET